MSLSELYSGREGGGSGSLRGTLTGTLSGASVGAPTPGGPDMEMPRSTRGGTFGLAAPMGSPVSETRGAPQMSATGALDPAVGPVPMGMDLGPMGTQGQLGLEQAGGDLLSTLVDVGGAPIKAVLGILSQLDRPQQFMWAATVKGLETGNAWEGLKSGLSAAIFRRPEPGGPKRRVEAEELIDTVGEYMFNKKGLTKSMPTLARTALSFGVTAAVDPLLFVPGTWYSKAGRGAREFYDSMVAADQARYAITGGTDLVVQASRARNSAISDFLFQAGKADQPLGQVIMKAGQNLNDEEMSVLRDIITGFGISHMDERLRPLISAAFEEGGSGRVNYAQVRTAMQEALESLDEGAVAELSDTISQIVATRRGGSDLDTFFTVRVGGRKRHARFETSLGVGTPLERDALMGQLVNRAGLDPTQAVTATSGRNVSAIFGGAIKQRFEALDKYGIRIVDGAATTDLMTAWKGLTGAQREALLKRGVTMPDGSARNLHKIARAQYGTEAELRAVIDNEEALNAVTKYIGEKAPKAWRETVGAAEFSKTLAKTVGVPNVPKAAKAYRVALQRQVGQGTYLVDAFVEQTLARRFAAIGLMKEAGKNMAEIASGVKPIEVMSELPSAAAKSDVLRSLVDASKAETKDIHLLWFLADPKMVMPDAMYARAKYGEDMFNAVANAMGREMDSLFQVGGKVIQEGGELDRRIGLAAFGDEMEELLKAGKIENDSTREFAEAAIKARDEIRLDGGDAAKVLGGMQAVFEGFRQAFIKRNFKEFAGGGIRNYMARVYPDYKRSIELGMKMGLIEPDEGAKMLRRARKDINAALSPLEMDFVDKLHVGFNHLRRRQEVPLPGLETSAIKLMRAYTTGGLRKLYIEPAVTDVANAARTLPRWKKTYTKLFLKRMLGYEVLDEAALNSLGEVVNNVVGKGLQAITGGRVAAEAFDGLNRPATRASLWITRNFYRGLLGGNLGFMLKNLTQGINTATQAGPLDVMRSVAMAVSNPVVGKNGETFRELVKSRNLLRDFNGIMEGAETVSGIGTNFRKFQVKMDDLLFAPARFSEYFNRGIALGAGMSQYMRLNRAALSKKGIDSVKDLFEKSPENWAKAVRYGHSVANETQFVYGVVGRSPIAGSPTGRMALQFFSWPIKQIEFLRRGWKDEGGMFFMRYVAFSGLVSSVAEHADIDAGGFTGFGFMPSQAAPSIQVLGHMNAALHSAFVEDDEVAASDHFSKMVNQMENMIPAFLQMNKFAKAAESISSGEQRGTRGRFARRTDDPGRNQRLSQVLDATINPVNQAFGLPALSGEQAVSLVGLPSVQRNQFREATRGMERRIRQDNKRHSEYTDAYIKAYYSGNFIKAERLRADALKEGVHIDPAAIKREVLEKQVPSMDRILSGARATSRLRIENEAFRENPEVFQDYPGIGPLPPDALGGARR